MTSDDLSDAMFRRLAALPPFVAGAARQEQVRTRCHAALAKPRHPPTRVNHGVPIAVLLRGALVLIAGFYLLETLREAWRLSHLL